MADVPWGAAAVELVRNAKPNAVALLLACFGVYGGEMAARFIHPFDVIASAICAMALFSGVLRSWSQKEVAGSLPVTTGVGSTMPNPLRRR